MLAKPLDLPLADERAVLSASFTNIQRPPGPTRLSSTRPATSSQTTAPATSSAPTTSTPTTTSEPPTSSETPTKTPPSSTTVTSDPPGPPAAPVDRVVDLVNQNRADAGCAALQVEPHLTAAAQNHATDMSQRDYFAHTTPEGATFDERIKTAGYPLPGAENIARGQKNAEQVMKDWMNSPGHRANILNCNLKVIGVGLVTEGFYWVQDFGF